MQIYQHLCGGSMSLIASFRLVRSVSGLLAYGLGAPGKGVRSTEAGANVFPSNVWVSAE
jgi:hypothetical protein